MEVPCGILYQKQYLGFVVVMWISVGLLWWLSGKQSACQCQRWVCSLGWEDPLEKEMATHSSIPAWEIPWTEEPGRLHMHGASESRRDTAEKTEWQQRQKHLHGTLSTHGQTVLWPFFIKVLIVHISYISKVVLILAQSSYTLKSDIIFLCFYFMCIACH